MTTSIDNVTVLGTGVLGSQIAYQTAYCGLAVIAYDISDNVLDRARKRFEELAARYEQEVRGASNGPARAALATIRYSSDLADAVRDADLVIESAPELAGVKRELYAKLGPLAPKKAIFATNSSTLLPSELADATGRPDRFLALHFANEIWNHNMAEIMGHPRTDPAVYDTVVEFARRIGMEPIKLHKEQSGYIVNSLLVPFSRPEHRRQRRRGPRDDRQDLAHRHGGTDRPAAVAGHHRAHHRLQHRCVWRRRIPSQRAVSQAALHRPGRARPSHGEGFYKYDRAGRAIVGEQG